MTSRLKILSALRLKPYNTETAEGRSRERYRRIALTTVTSLIAKGATSLIALVTIPLTINYFGKEQYGLWMIVSSVVIWLQLSDFGINNGLKK